MTVNKIAITIFNVFAIFLCISALTLFIVRSYNTTNPDFLYEMLYFIPTFFMAFTVTRNRLCNKIYFGVILLLLLKIANVVNRKAIFAGQDSSLLYIGVTVALIVFGSIGYDIYQDNKLSRASCE